ncbi:MAG: peptidoglycan editing factor PgeF [Betaproteobacteria bacterium]|nr:peptidoglycan editing factor PgeF [Betaproteobacteria bacterium]
MSAAAGWIVPDWSAPPRVRAFSTTRPGGTSEGEYASLNLGLSSGDDPLRVGANRAIVRAHLPGDPVWMRQVHGTAVADLDAWMPGEVPEADAAAVSRPGRVAVVLTADCLPVVLARGDGARVAVAHAGWRGLSAGVLEATVAALGGDPGEAFAWLGPAIGPRAFEVGPEVREAFLDADGGAGGAFAPHGTGKYLADLYALARRRLARAGIARVDGGGRCTLSEPDALFSYRRAKASGRQGTFAWIDPAGQEAARA